jgi:bifunctional non-homologous end joining protein LigD
LKCGETLRGVTATPVLLVVKDILALDGLDARSLPTVARRSLVTALVPELGYVRAAPALEGDEAQVLARCAALGIAAVVAKPKDAPYAAEKPTWTLVETGAAPRSRTAVDHGGALRKVTVSNREKIFWPAQATTRPAVRAYTKGDLVDYYASVADVLCPFLKERPVILVRYPDGIEGKSFFQWRVPAGMPPWIRTLTIRDAEDERVKSGAKTAKRGFLVEDPSTLVYIANLGCIPLHVLASRARDLGQADFFTIDFDVKQSELRHAITLARTLKGLLDAIGLVGYPKTSGQTGLHVLVPLGAGQTFETARALADLLGRLLVEQHPDLATMERVVARRGPRVYVDTGQTGASRAIVAPYSVRAVPGATVSTPLAWDEVVPELDPRAFTMVTVPERLARRGDLLAGLLAERPDVPRAVATLAEVVPRSVRRSGDRRA